MDLNVSPEISLSLFRPFMCQMSRSRENDLKYFSNALKRDGSVMAVLPPVPAWTLSSFRSLIKGQIIMNAWAHTATETGFIQL